MKICIISSGYPSKGRNDNSFVEQLVNEFVRQGNQCVVIAPRQITSIHSSDLALPYYENRYLASGGNVEIYRPKFFSRNIIIKGVSLSRYLAQRVVEKVIKRHDLRFDCFYCHFFAMALSAWHYAHKYGIPLFLATGESTIRNYFEKPCFSFSWDKFRADTAGVVCVSRKNLDECVSLGYAEELKCEVFPNGANLFVFKHLDKAECRRKLGFAAGDFITATVGEFSNRKGQKRIIDAIDSLNISNIKSVFIGSGEALPDRGYILYKGKVIHSELPVYLNAADVFVLPTLREGCCNAIVEAMACGLPVVSSNLAFNNDILNKDNSILIDPERPEEIANALKSLYQNSELLASMHTHVLNDAEELSLEKRATNILNFISKRI